MGAWKNKRKVRVIGVVGLEQYLQKVDVGGMVLI